MRRAMLTIFAVLASATLPAVAQAQGGKSDFSGSWVLQPEKSQAPVVPQAAQLFVTQSDKLLTLEHVSTTSGATRTNKLSYHIDGVPSKNSTTGPGGAPLDFNSTTSWDGPTLVITTTADMVGGFKQVERWTMSADGKELTIKGDIAISGQTATAKMFYTKK
jgi:hypothetical protein